MGKGTKPYDDSSLESIFEYAKHLEGHTLREVCDLEGIADPHVRKGAFGNALEEFYFRYGINSDPDADFSKVGTELKSTPLKLGKKGRLSAKERLVISMINYMKVVDETWETSSVQKKLRSILLVAYLYEKGVSPIDYLIKLVELWGIPTEDVKVFKSDWDTVVEKIRHGLAHELSGSDTLYLEAATKAATSKDRRPQPFSPIPAKPRAWAIKQSYMTATFNAMLDAQAIERRAGEEELGLLGLVRRRFEPYVGLTEEELASVCGYLKPGRRRPKNLCALITKHILGVGEDKEISEFVKAGVKTKTIRLKRNGVPKESISFPTFDYFELADLPFEESDFREQLRRKYLFVIYREDAAERGVFRLSEVVFWQMRDRDLLEARRCYEEMQRRVREGRADKSVTSKENRCCHVRPHGRNKDDTLMTPYGVPVTKKCFWLNASFVGQEIDRVRREENTRSDDERAQVGAVPGNDEARAPRCSEDWNDVPQTIRVAELFAGVGGFRLGLDGYHDERHPEFEKKPAGPYATVWANQWEPPGTRARQFAARCYEARFGSSELVNEDINRVLDEYEEGRIDIPDVDMVVGGFPCQDYSVAKPLAQAKGIAGKKGVLWWDIYRFLQLKSPRFALLENVDRLLKSPASQRGRDFAIILSCFASLGYAVEWRVVNSAEYGFPQRRRRVYIFAEKTDDAWDLEERLSSGVMAEALPIEPVEAVSSFDVLADPYENSEKFGAGRKTSPFKSAGVMQHCHVRTADAVESFDGRAMTLGDVLVDDKDVPEEFYIASDQLEKWRYFKGSKSEPRVNKKTGYTYNYTEGAMAFPDAVDRPSRTLLTSEGGVGLPVETYRSGGRREVPSPCAGRARPAAGVPEGMDGYRHDRRAARLLHGQRPCRGRRLSHRGGHRAAVEVILRRGDVSGQPAIADSAAIAAVTTASRTPTKTLRTTATPLPGQ